MLKKWFLFLALGISQVALADKAEINAARVEVIEKYLNNLQNFTASFKQRDYQGNVNYGKLFVSDNKILWEYTKPRQIAITVCEDNNIIYHDKELNNREQYELHNPFITFLSDRPISLTQNQHFYLSKVEEKKDEIEVVVASFKKSVGGFILHFERNFIALKALTIFDDFANPVEISFKDIVIHQEKIDPKMFNCKR